MSLKAARKFHSTRFAITDALAMLPVGTEAREIVMGPLAFAEVFGAGAKREGARFLDVPVRVDIRAINPHDWEISVHEKPVLPDFVAKSRAVEALAFAVLGGAVFLVGYVVFLAWGVQ